MSSFEIFRILIKHYKDDSLGYETFSDAVNEFSSDPSEIYQYILGLKKYTNNIESYDFADLKLLGEEDREKMAFEISNLSQEYFREVGLGADWIDDLD